MGRSRKFKKLKAKWGLKNDDEENLIEVIKPRINDFDQAAANCASEASEYLPQNAIFISEKDYLQNKDIDKNYNYNHDKFYYTKDKFISFIYKTKSKRRDYMYLSNMKLKSSI